MRDNATGGWRRMALLLVLATVVVAPTAAAEGPAPQSDDAPGRQASPDGADSTNSTATTSSTSTIGPGGQGCRPMCF